MGVHMPPSPMPYQASRRGGRSHPRPCCPVRHRRPGGDERNSKRPHGIGESGVCASSGVHCVHRPPTSHARSSTAQVVGFSSESRPHEPNRPPCVGALYQPPTRLPARTLRQRDAALHGGLQAAVLHEDPDITLDDGPVDPVDLAADFVVEFGGVGISRPVGEHRLRPAPLVRCPDDDHDFDPAAAIPKRLPEFAVRGTPGAVPGLLSGALRNDGEGTPWNGADAGRRIRTSAPSHRWQRGSRRDASHHASVSRDGWIRSGQGPASPFAVRREAQKRRHRRTGPDGLVGANAQ